MARVRSLSKSRPMFKTMLHDECPTGFLSSTPRLAHVIDKQRKARVCAEALWLSKMREARGNREEARISTSEHEAQKTRTMLIQHEAQRACAIQAQRAADQAHTRNNKRAIHEELSKVHAVKIK